MSTRIAAALILAALVATGFFLMWPRNDVPTDPAEVATASTDTLEVDSPLKSSVELDPDDGQDRSQSGEEVTDPISVRERALKSWEPWSPELLRDLHAMHPADLLEFLNDDELLQHDDARNLVSRIYSACGVYLGLLSARESGAQIDPSNPAYQMLENPGAEWCASMTEGDAASSARDRLAELQEISSVVDPAGTPRRQLAEENIRRANSAGGDQLLELLNSRDSLTAALAVELLWEQRNQQFLEDWSLVESLSTTQRQNVMRSLYTTLECQQLGDCSVDTLSVGAMCLRPTFQCGGQISLDGVLYQSLSRRQLDAYYQLITRIRQIRAGSP